MPSPMKKLENAKKMLEKELISQEIYEQIQQQSLLEIGMFTDKDIKNEGENDEQNSSKLQRIGSDIVDDDMEDVNILGSTHVQQYTSFLDDSLFGETRIEMHVGMTLENYEIIDIIGQGGMGTVFRGRHEKSRNCPKHG